MPRIYSSQGEPFDFCKECFPTIEEAYDALGMLGDGPDLRGNCFSYETEHPGYGEDDLSDYKCNECGKQLTEVDN